MHQRGVKGVGIVPRYSPQISAWADARLGGIVFLKAGSPGGAAGSPRSQLDPPQRRRGLPLDRRSASLGIAVVTAAVAIRLLERGAVLH
jgi:hypothetical protein